MVLWLMKKEMQLMVLSLGMMVETALCVASGMDLKITKLAFERLLDNTGDKGLSVTSKYIPDVCGYLLIL